MSTTKVKIWDAPVRLFHWLLVGGIAFAWFTAETGGNWMEWHERTGMFLLSLILFRLIWGFIGSDTARFSQFVKSPIEALHHWQEVRTQPTAYHAGHNPLGAWMVIALLGIVLFQGMTGLFATDDIATEGPLSGLVSGDTAEILTSIHHLVFNFILLLAAVHIAAVLFYRFGKKTNLIKPMVLGEADWPLAQQPLPQPLGFKPVWLGLGIWAGCYALVYFGIKWLAA